MYVSLRSTSPLAPEEKHVPTHAASANAATFMMGVRLPVELEEVNEQVRFRVLVCLCMKFDAEEPVNLVDRILDGSRDYPNEYLVDAVIGWTVYFNFLTD